MGLRARLAVMIMATVTFVFAAGYFLDRTDLSYKVGYHPCWEAVNGLPCRISRKIPIDDWGLYGVILAATLLLLPLFIFWVLAPIRRLAPVIAEIGPQNLGRRVRPGRGRDEAKRVGRALDDMMDRIASGYEGQRTFAANASHELRTPLALQRTLIEVGMAEPLTAEQQTLLVSQLLATNARNERLIEGLLVLSEADQGLATRTPQHLHRITADVVAAADAPGLTVTTHLHPYRLAGDGVLLERLVRNLVHNAVKYNRPGGSVHVTVGGDAALTVRNTGPVVAPEDVGRLFEPFTRLSGDRIDHSGGSGLGLAIVRSIVQAHDGTVVAAPNDGGGLLFTIRFPASA